MRFVLAFILLILSSSNIFGQFSNFQKLNLGNSSDSQILPVIVDSGIVFMSNHRTGYFKTVVDESDNLPYQLYFVKTDSSKIIGKKNVFSNKISTKLNNGPITFNKKGNIALVSLNQSTQEEDKKCEFLGLYFIFKTTDGWSELEAFKYNSSEYSITHPALSADGQTLVFSSKEDGEIPKLYYSLKNNEKWSKPKMVSSNVNSDYANLFPSFFGNNTLYFSSNRNNQGLDIWKCFLDGESYSKPEILDSTINTEFDEFGITLKEDGKSGYVSSNRQGTDAIYYFESEIPKFEDCKPEQEIYLCYDLEETDIELEEGTPLVFEWDLGDGVKKRGKKIEHCFPGPGSYIATVSLIDTLEGESFFNISTIPIGIVAENQHNITTNDELLIGKNIRYEIDYDWANYTAKEIYWMVNGLIDFDKTLQITIKDTSSYTIKSLVIDSNGRSHCVIKEIQVSLENENPEILPGSIEVDKLENAGYTVGVVESLNQLSLTDSTFNPINYPIYELFSEVDSIYTYSVGSSEKAASLYYLYQEMKQLGFESQMLTLENENDIKEVESDGLLVFFGTGLAEITSYNQRNINLFAKRIDATKSYKILGYADARGSLDLNKKLSQERAQAVKTKLIEFGCPESVFKIEVIGEAGTENANDEMLKTYRKVEVIED